MRSPAAIEAQSSLLLRRRFLLDAGAGFGWAALSWLLQREANAATGNRGVSPLAAKKPHFAPKAKRVMQVFAVGGMSHLDTFDYKPELSARDGRPFDMQTFFGQAGNLYKSPFAFERRGESGLWVSSLLPHLAQCADKLTLIHSMAAKSANHMPAVAQMNTGFTLSGFPSMGAWITYGLGTENENLPAFVVLPDPRALPWGGKLQWSASFLPASYQGTAFRTSGQPVPDLATPEQVSPSQREASLEWLKRMNIRYQRQHPGDSTLEARLRAASTASMVEKPTGSAANACSRGACWSGECGLFRSSMGVPRRVGTPTRNCKRTMPRWPKSTTCLLPGCFKTWKRAVCSTIR